LNNSLAQSAGEFWFLAQSAGEFWFNKGLPYLGKSQLSCFCEKFGFLAITFAP